MPALTANFFPRQSTSRDASPFAQAPNTTASLRGTASASFTPSGATPIAFAVLRSMAIFPAVMAPSVDAAAAVAAPAGERAQASPASAMGLNTPSATAGSGEPVAVACIVPQRANLSWKLCTVRRGAVLYTGSRPVRTS